MAYPILQSSTESPLIFFMVESADHITGLTGASPTVTISKNGAAFASPSGAVSEIANGFYKVAGNATDTGTLGPIALHATAASGDPCDIVVAYVTTCDPQTNIAQTGDAYLRLGAPAGASIAADIAEIEGETDTIVTQTGAAAIATAVWTDTTAGDFTTASSIGKSVMNGVSLGTGLTVNALTTNNDKTGYGLSSAAVSAIWQDTTAGDFTTASSIGKSIMNGVALGTGLTINGYTGNTPQTGDAYALMNGTTTEPTSVPAATASRAVKIDYLFLKTRNKSTQTSTTQLIRNNADNATVATITVSDDGTTFVKSVDT